MLITTVAVPDGRDTPSAVCISPCTIHGWRPFSVSIQPAVFITNGARTAQIASRQEPAATSADRLRHSSQPPHSDSRNSSPRRCRP